jgi:hypothetical protein|tara:strand:+ start:97 stop:300 length:204 start_codon:yes stop_codon:yes gene_type:complete
LAVKHPKHYNQGSIEVWDFIQDQDLNFFEGNIVKYICRWKDKGGIEDLQKVKEYTQKYLDIVNKTSK